MVVSETEPFSVGNTHSPRSPFCMDRRYRQMVTWIALPRAKNRPSDLP